MKIYIFLLISSFVISLVSKAQDSNLDTLHRSKTIYLPDYYKEKGVVFSKDYMVGIVMRSFKNRYTPTNDDIIKAEKILSVKYKCEQNTNIDTKSFFCHWVRQYVGLIDSNGNKNIIVQIIDNTKPRKINKLLGKDWEDVFVIMLADSFYKVSNRFRINIDTGDFDTQL